MWVLGMSVFIRIKATGPKQEAILCLHVLSTLSFLLVSHRCLICCSYFKVCLGQVLLGWDMSSLLLNVPIEMELLTQAFS